MVNGHKVQISIFKCILFLYICQKKEMSFTYKGLFIVGGHALNLFIFFSVFFTPSLSFWEEIYKIVRDLTNPIRSSF